uniref:Uncharacterized protein n=1 Tax=Mustela putorius furo TaxID=9669 RepID=M3Y1S2_MUSPF
QKVEKREEKREDRKKQQGTRFCGVGGRGGESGGKKLGVKGSWSLRGGKVSLAKARDEPERLSWRPRSLEGCSNGESAVSAPAGCASFRVGRWAVQGGRPPGSSSKRIGAASRRQKNWWS